MKGSFWQLYTACIQSNNNRNFHIYIIVQHIARKTALHNALQFPMIYDSINCSSQLSIRHKIFRLFTNQVSLVHIGKRWVGTLINIQNAVDDSPVTDFRYLGSIQSSSGRCYTDIHVHRRIGVASSAMHTMQRCWRQQRLSLDTKLRLYQTCVLQILLYGADTWTLLANDIRRLQSFHMGCQRQILGVWWHDHVKNVDIADTTGLPNITDIVDKKRHALFGHVVRLDTSVSAYQALKQVIAMKAARCSGTNWRRLPGRPDWRRNNNQLETDVAECRGAWTSWGAVATDHSRLRVTMMMMMRNSNELANWINAVNKGNEVLLTCSGSSSFIGWFLLNFTIARTTFLTPTGIPLTTTWSSASLSAPTAITCTSITIWRTGATHHWPIVTQHITPVSWCIPMQITHSSNL